MAERGCGGYNALVPFFRFLAMPLACVVLLVASCSDTTTSDAELADAPTPTATETVAPVESAPAASGADDATDAERAERVAILDQIVAPYPGVRATLEGDVAVLVGVVETFDDNVAIDAAVRDAGFAISNSINVLEEPSEQDPAAAYTLIDLVKAQPELSHLDQLIEAAGLSEVVADPTSGLTVLAPTDAAFAMWLGDPNLDARAFESWLETAPIDPVALANHHLLDGAVSALDITSAETTTRLGEPLVGEIDFLINDVETTNGTLHVISTVLVPTALWADVPEELGAALELEPITFAPGGSTLTDEGRTQLDLVVDYLSARPGLRIEVGGHTDADGADETNFALSLARAEAVTSYLVAGGIARDSLTAVGYGEGQPIAPNDTDDNKALNRRIEFRPA